MSLYILCLVLLSVSSTFSYNLFGRNFKRDVTINVNRYAFSELAEKCSQDLNNFKNYYDCTGFANITRENFRDVCITFNSQKCQEVLKDPMSFIPNCKESLVISEIFSDVAIDMRKAEMNVICNTDENDQLCPVAEIFIDYNKNHTETKNAIRMSCKSKKCINIMIDVLPIFLSDTKKAESLTITEGEVDADIDKNVDEWVDFLKSSKCRNQYSISNASSIKIKLSGILILILSLILFFI